MNFKKLFFSILVISLIGYVFCNFKVTNGQLDAKEELKNDTMITPLFFGAKADGSSDDTIPIQKAIDYAIIHNKTLDGLGREYIVGDGMKLPPDISTYEKGIFVNGSVIIKNIRLKLKDQVSDFTSVMNIAIGHNKKVLLENVFIDGNLYNQDLITTKRQDGGLHGIRVKYSSGEVLIDNCNVKNCYSDGILISSGKYEKLVIRNTLVADNGRNGITDNAYSSYIENCVIQGNGVRTAPRSGYHIEPDKSADFGLKCIVSSTIKNNNGRDFKIHFNKNRFNIDQLSIDRCDIGSFGWAHYSQSLCFDSNLQISNTSFSKVFRYTKNNKDVLSQGLKINFVNCTFYGDIHIVGNITENDAYNTELLFNDTVSKGNIKLQGHFKDIFINNSKLQNQYELSSYNLNIKFLI